MLRWPCSAWIALKREAAKSIASSQETTRHSSEVDSRTIGVVMRSWCDA